jgi:hypothetical protein
VNTWQRCWLQAAARSAQLSQFTNPSALGVSILCSTTHRCAALYFLLFNAACMISSKGVLDATSFAACRCIVGSNLDRFERMPKLFELPRLRSAGSKLPLRALPTMWLPWWLGMRVQRWFCMRLQWRFVH